MPAADNVIRLLPPLTISDAEIAEAVARLERAANRVRPMPHERRTNPPHDHSSVPKYSRGEWAPQRGAQRGRQPLVAPPRKALIMNHFLDIHKTDPAALRAMIDAARPDEGRPQGPAQRHPRCRTAAGRAHGGADLRETLDPHPRLVRCRRAADGWRDDGAVRRRHAAGPWRDHRRHRPRAVALCRPDHDPHLRGTDAAGNGRTCDGAGDQRADQPHPSLPDHGRRDDLRGTSRPDRRQEGGLDRRRQQRLCLVPACRRAVRLRLHLHRAVDAGPRG